MPAERIAIVHRHDPQLPGVGPHSQIGLVVIPRHVRPFAAVTATVDGMENDSCTQPRQLLAQMGVRDGRTARVSPQIVADQTSHRNTLESQYIQRTGRIGLNLTFRSLGEAAASQYLAVAPQEAAICVIEANLNCNTDRPAAS